MNWLLRLAALVAVVLLLRWLWLWFWRHGWTRLFLSTLERTRPSSAPSVRTGTFKRDPVCGTHVDVQLSVQENVDGRILHFCSERCRQAYRARQSRSAQGLG